MSPNADSYRYWNYCDMCGYEGMFVFRCRADENYDDPEALGVMLDSACPACEHRESVLVTMEEYQKMCSLPKRDST